MTNPYKVLGVNEGATNEEIRAAYLSLVKKYHPDKYTDPDMKQLANEKLKEINEAYDQLTKNLQRVSRRSIRRGRPRRELFRSRSGQVRARARPYQRGQSGRGKDNT